MIGQRTDLMKYWSRLQRVVAEEGVHLGNTLRWITAMYKDRLRLRLPKGVLPNLEFVDELLLLTQIPQTKGTKK